MIDYLGYILVRFLSFVFCLLPLRFGLFVGRRFGTLAFLLNKKRRRVAYANLKAAFCKEKTPTELKRIVKGVYQNLGQVLVEVLRFPAIDKRYVKKFITLKGLEKIKEARAKNKGVIILTAHFGNWELGGLVSGFLNLPISVLAREQGHTRLNELLNSYRQMAGSKVIKKGLSTRELIKALRANEVIAILTDQDAGKFGTFVNFFGRPTSTHSGAFAFAQKTGAEVLPAFIVRQKGPYHRIDMLGPIGCNDSQDPKKAITLGLQNFSSLLESYARKFPTQWLWVHKRWKSTPLRSVLILNDGKPGHLNQSLAVANIIQKYREDKGYHPENTRCEIIDVKYKNKFLRPPLAFCSNFSNSNCQGCMRCIKFCLPPESYQRLMSSYADIVISCGASTAPLNVFLTKELNAKNIVIMKPSLVSLKKFNLAIIPRHDRPKGQRNILVTVGSPNRIGEELIQKEALRFSSFVDQAKPLRLGLLLGGDNPDYKMGLDLIKNLISQIKAISKKLDLEILATTSRRTPRDVELLLKEELTKLPNCKLLVIANEKNIDGTIPAILGLCKVILVSGESISMISEAASSGKSVVVFALDKKKAKHSRHEDLVKELDSSGFIKFVDVNETGSTVEEAINSNIVPKRLNDYEKIYNAVGGLL